MSELTLCDIQVSGSTTPSRTTRPARYVRLASSVWYFNEVQHTSGNTGARFRSNGTIKRSEELTVKEIESKYGAIRDPPEVNRFILPHKRISQRDEISNGRTCSEVFQVRPNGSVLATPREIPKLAFGHVGLGVQFVEVSFVEPSGDGLVDTVGHGVLPERLIFLQGIETCNDSGAGDSIQSADCT